MVYARGPQVYAGGFLSKPSVVSYGTIARISHFYLKRLRGREAVGGMMQGTAAGGGARAAC